jgi:type IV secretory pathway VirB4 component
MAKAKVKTAAFDDVMPVHAFEQNKVVFKDGRVALGFVVEPAEMESWLVADYEAFHNVLLGAARALSVGTILQKTDLYYDRPYRPAKNKAGAYYEGKLNDHFSERLVLFQKSYLFISFAPVGVKTTRTNAITALISRAGESFIKNPFAELIGTLELAEGAAMEFAQTISGHNGVHIERMESEELYKLYLQYFNLEFDNQPIRQEREIAQGLGTFSVGENRVNVVSMIGQGSEVTPAVRNTYKVASPMIYPLTHNLDFPHILTQSLLIQDRRTELSALDSDRKRNGLLGFLAGQDNQLRTLQIEELTAEIRADDKQIVSMHLSVILWDSNDNRRKENVEKTQAAFRAIFNTETVVEAELALPVFFGALPGNAWQIPERWLTTTSDRGLCHTHWATTYRSDNTGEVLVDRYRNPVRINLFNDKIANQNAILIGPTGMGKSYTFGDFITQRYENGARQIILDVGGTYRNTMQALNGDDFDKTYFEYDPQKPMPVNPFLVERNPETKKWIYIGGEADKINFHLALIAGLWKGGNKDLGLDKSERTILSEFLIGYYDYLNNDERLGQRNEDFPMMESFYRWMERHDAEMQKPITPHVEGQEPDPLNTARRQYQKNLKYIDMHQFFLVLSQYISGGRYAKVFSSTHDIDLSEYRLICFDLKKVQQDPDLYPVVAMLITELSLDIFRKFENDVKYIVLDEAWTMLSGVLSEFIESMYRTIRKTNGSVTIITQGINEIVQSRIGRAIIGNTLTFIILRHENPADLDLLQIPLGFTNHEMDLIRSIRFLPAVREIFIKQDGRSKIFGVEVPPEMDAILTSRPKERDYLNLLISRFQQTITRVKLDKEGRPVMGSDGPVIEVVKRKNIEHAVAQFVEDKQSKRGAFAK